jgi:NAD(P)-dependent dehydrogenase (short-subunit alcohol dehydrogenase family)
MLTALVTGANRGIGLEVCRQLASQGLHVILTGRSAPAVSDSVKFLASSGLDVRGEVLDVASQESVLACAVRLDARGEHADVLINNAGVYPEGDLLSVASEVLTEAYGALGPRAPGSPA